MEHIKKMKQQAINDLEEFLKQSAQLAENQKLMLELQLNLISDLKSNLKLLYDLLPDKNNK